MSRALQLIERSNAVGRADAKALGGVDRAAGHDQLLCDPEPDHRGQPARAADVRDQAELGLGEAEERVL